MNWDNYCKEEGQWSLDHTICCELFDFSLPAHQMAALHYTNLRPLWHIDNMKKNDRLSDGRRARHLTQEERNRVLMDLGYGYLFEEACTGHYEI